MAQEYLEYSGKSGQKGEQLCDRADKIVKFFSNTLDVPTLSACPGEGVDYHHLNTDYN